jgi:hypothetical protein
MFYYYETQPIPNPLSIFFHRLPRIIHKLSIIFTFLAELLFPFGLFVPNSTFCAICVAPMILFQITIIISGNLSWLNYISLVLCIPALDDKILSTLHFHPLTGVIPTPPFYILASFLLLGFVLWRSIYPIKNMISRHQSMNRGYDPFHLVNTYGAFGSITRKRNELVVLGTEDDDPLTTAWKSYEFKGKPTDPRRLPPLMSPYHWRLDWLMWFAAFSDYTASPWILPFIARLLSAQPDVLRLLKKDPFEGRKPKWIKVDYYKYKFQVPGGEGYWRRTYLGEWLPPINLRTPTFRRILQANEWMPE